MAWDVRLIRSPISIAGMVITTISAVVFIVVLLGDLFGLHTNPYLGILFFLFLPALFVLGLRHLGAARTGAYFSLAPFVGAVLAVIMLHTIGERR